MFTGFFVHDRSASGDHNTWYLEEEAEESGRHLPPGVARVHCHRHGGTRRRRRDHRSHNPEHEHAGGHRPIHPWRSFTT
jgi:hypothetical protein